MSPTCAICTRPAPDPLRSGGLDICFKCMHGGAVQAADDRGWSIDYGQSAIPTTNGMVYTVRAEGRLASSVPFEVVVRPKLGILKLIGMFWGIKMPDPLFNRMAFATSSSPRAGASFLGDDGVQSAVMDLLGEQVTITVGQAGVEIHGQAEQVPFDQSRIELEIAVLMAHIQRFKDGIGTL